VQLLREENTHLSLHPAPLRRPPRTPQERSRAAAASSSWSTAVLSAVHAGGERGSMQKRRSKRARGVLKTMLVASEVFARRFWPPATSFRSGIRTRTRVYDADASKLAPSYLSTLASPRTRKLHRLDCIRMDSFRVRSKVKLFRRYARLFIKRESENRASRGSSSANKMYYQPRHKSVS